MDTTTTRRPFAAAACLLCALALGLAAPHAASAERTKKKPGGHVAQAKERRGGQAKFEKAGGETAAERDRRLQRECRGRPNAGACQGYGG